MRIEQLEYVAAVTRHGSLRRASEHLHVSQPALSEAVSKLERELGVRLLDRRRTGSRISGEGRQLLHHMVEVLEAVDRLKVAAGERGSELRQVRVGTVSAATSTLLVPAVEQVLAGHPGGGIEVLTLRQREIDEGLREGSLDLGLVNVLAGDETPSDLDQLELLRGRPVAVLPAGHRLLALDAVGVEDLRDEPFVGMRPGYVMHRFAHRLFGARLPIVRHSADGAEMGKTLVAQGLGVTVLPDFSVAEDPLVRAGLIDARPLRDDRSGVTLVLRQHRSSPTVLLARALRDALVDRARRYVADGVTPAPALSR